MLASRGFWITAAFALAVGGVVVDRSVRAADHVDPPSRTDPATVGALADVAADIADVYFWHSNGTAKLALTNGGPRVPGLPPVYDSNVVYLLHISTDGNVATDEQLVDIRYGRDPAGNWGVRIAGVPGTTAPIVGPVQTTLTSGPVRAIAGLFDDPFFFDLQGFRTTRSTGTLSFNNQRNFFRGQNDTAVVIQIPKSRLANGSNPIRVWATRPSLGIPLM